MYRFLCALALALLSPSVCFAQQSLVGTYKLVSFTLEVDGKPGHGTVGPNPHGTLIITPKHYLHGYTGQQRKFGTSVEEKAALWDTLNFWGGPYQLEGNKLIVSVEHSWNENWKGGKQTRIIKWDGKRVRMTSPPMPFPRDPSKTVVSTLIWEKVE